MDGKQEKLEDLIARNVYSEEKARSSNPAKSALSLGDIACSFGHTLIFKKIEESDFDCVMVFEDDVFINPDALSNISEVFEAIPEDADLIYWGYDRFAKRRKFHFFWKLYWHFKLVLIKLLFRKNKNGFYIDDFPVVDHTMIENLHIRPYNKHFSIASAYYPTHAYSINRKAAKELLEIQTPVSRAADFLLIDGITHKKFKAYIVNKPLFIQDKYRADATLTQYVER